jgi:hypothetical protein
VVKDLQAASSVSLRAVAAGLDERGIPAAQRRQWSATQVMQLLEHIGPFEVADESASAT